jgi:hypothetical protein
VADRKRPTKAAKQAGQSAVTVARNGLPTPPERLLTVRLVGQRSLELVFADGYTRRLAIGRLELPLDRVRWDTVTASPTGESMTVIGVKGETIPVSASTLRYLVDPASAAKTDKALADIALTKDELNELHRTTEPPAGWRDESIKGSGHLFRALF